MTHSPILYKFTNGSRPIHGTGTYPTRRDGRTLSTAWLPTVPEPVLCARGWHVTTAAHLPWHLGADLYVVEVAGAAVYGGGKSAHERLRFRRRVAAWTPEVAAEFARSCAAAARAADYADYAAAERKRQARWLCDRLNITLED